MKIPKMFRSEGKNLDRKIEEFLTKKFNDIGDADGKHISTLKLKTVWNGKGFFVTYERVVDYKDLIGTVTKISKYTVTPEVREKKDVINLMKFTDEISHYHGDHKLMSISNKGKSEVWLKAQLSSEDLVDAFREFYSKLGDIQILKIEYG